jgi:valyl-tRNA synthetase
MTPVVVMDEAGRMCGSIPAKYIGKDRFEARKLIVADMEAAGLVEKIDKHTHAVGHCYRCSTVVEPYYSDQWFVKMKPLAEPALKAATEDRIAFYPARWKKTYVEWMENIRDWCISRQIWWGHRIPVWYCGSCAAMIVEEETPQACPHCHSSELRQDEDVLDTWFSSWLWPFSTMDWPDESAHFRKFYPTATLATAPDILFFWVARMLMAGLHFTGKLPFSDIILHGTVRDKSGRKMSKSLGNSIDPLVIIKEYGTDALRFSMMMITAQGADVFLSKDTFDIGRNFANKLWNASRFLLSNITEKVAFEQLPAGQFLKAEDRWILSRLAHTIRDVRAAIDQYRLNEVCHLLYDFTWRDFCDWYIETKKTDFYQQDDPQQRLNALNICATVLASILKLLHPVMPFITEEIWQNLRQSVAYPALIDHETIMLAAYPVEQPGWINDAQEEQFELLKEVIVALRTIRAENNIPPDKSGTAIIVPATPADSAWLSSQTALINMFARLSHASIDPHAVKPKFAGQAVVRGVTVYLELEGLIDRRVETERLTKEIDHHRAVAQAAHERLGNESFISRAPAAVVEKEKEKYQSILQTIEKLEKSLQAIKG